MSYFFNEFELILQLLMPSFFFKKFEQIWELLMSFFGRIWKNLWEPLVSYFGKIWKNLRDLFKGIKNILGSLWLAILRKFEGSLGAPAAYFWRNWKKSYGIDSETIHWLLSNFVCLIIWLIITTKKLMTSSQKSCSVRIRFEFFP